MSDEKKVFFVSGTDYNVESEYASFIVGYFSSKEMAQAAVEDYVREKFEIEPDDIHWIDNANKQVTPYLVKTAVDSIEEENFNIIIEAFPLDKTLAEA